MWHGTPNLTLHDSEVLHLYQQFVDASCSCAFVAMTFALLSILVLSVAAAQSCNAAVEALAPYHAL